MRQNTLRFSLYVTGNHPQVHVGQDIGDESLAFSVKDIPAIIQKLNELMTMSDMGIPDKCLRTELEVEYE